MSLPRLLGLLLLALVGLASPAYSQTQYYVSVSGSDANNGSSASPWRTLAHAAAQIPAGTTAVLNVLPGTYVESSPVVLKPGTSLIGAGADQTTIKSTILHDMQNNGWNYNANKFLIQVRNASDTTLRGFKLDGLVSPGVRAHAGILLLNVVRARVHELEVRDFDLTGIWMATATDSRIYDSRFFDTGFAATGGSSGAIKLGNLTDCYIHDLHIRDTRGGDGIDTMRHDWTGPPGQCCGPNYFVALTRVHFYNLDIDVLQIGAWRHPSTNASIPGISIELWNANPTDVLIYNSRLRDTVSLVGTNYNNQANTVTLFNNEFLTKPRGSMPNGSGYSYAIEVSTPNIKVFDNYFENGYYPLADFSNAKRLGLRVERNIFHRIELLDIFHIRGGVNYLTFRHNITTLDTNLAGTFALARFIGGTASPNITVERNAFTVLDAAPVNNTDLILLSDGATLGTNVNVSRNHFHRWKVNGTLPQTGDPRIAYDDYRVSHDSPLYDLGMANIDMRGFGLRADYTFANPHETPRRVWLEPASGHTGSTFRRIEVGQTLQFAVHGRTLGGFVADIPAANIAYSIAPAGVATVSASGLVTAQAQGIAKLTATVTKNGVTRTSSYHVYVGLDRPLPEPDPLNLALGKTATASNVYQNRVADFGPQRVNDGDPVTRWATDSNISSAWIEVNFGAATTFNKTVFTEAKGFGNRIKDYAIEYWNGSAWIVAHSGTLPAATQTDVFPAVSATRIRLHVLNLNNTVDGPTIFEFGVYHDPEAEPDPEPPTTPTLLQATAASPTRADLAWAASTDNRGVAGYRIFRNGAQVGVATATTFSDHGLTPGRAYAYAVAAFDAAGNVSPASALASITTPAVPAQPSGNLALNRAATASNVYQNRHSEFGAAKVNDGSGTTRWATDSNIPGAWVEIDLGAERTFNKTVFTEDKTYGNRIKDYAIQFWDGAAWLNAATGTLPGSVRTDVFAPVTARRVRLNVLNLNNTTHGPTVFEFEVYYEPVAGGDTTPPGAPSGLVANAIDAHQIDLGWTPSTDDVGVVGYRILRDGVLVATVSTAAFVDEGLAPTTNYTYVVHAFDAAGNLSAASSPVVGRTLAETGAALRFEDYVAAISDPALRGAAHDPDGDGLPNLIEFALGRDPASSEPAPRLEPSPDAPGWLDFRFTVDPVAAGVALSADISTDLQSWAMAYCNAGCPVVTGPDLVVLDEETPEGLRAITVRVRPSAGSPRFVRLRANVISP
jgi:chitodextrinase